MRRNKKGKIHLDRFNRKWLFRIRGGYPVVRRIQKKELFFLGLLLYLGFLGYGNLCLFDHSLDFSHPIENPDFPLPHQHHDSKDSRSLIHSCLVIQFLLYTSLVSGLFFIIFILFIYLCKLSQSETFYRTPIFPYANRSPPDLFKPAF